MDLFCNATGGFNLDVTASGDFSADITANQLFFAPSGTPISADGAAAGAPWTAYSSSASVSVLAGEPRPTGWVAYDQAIEFMLEDSDPALDPAQTITLTYTIENL